MKRTIAIIIILISAFSLCACSKILGSNENNKIYGKVIELNDDEVTLEIGELKNLPQNQGGGPKNKDSGSADTSGKPEDIEPPGGQNSNSDTPPEKPDGQNSDSETPPEKPDSENGDDLNTPPDKPDGDMESPDDENRDDSNTPPSKPEEVSGANSSENSDEGSSPSENPPEGGSNNFVATGEEKTFNIASAKIFTQSGDQVSTSSVENIKKDSILALELNGEDEVVSATIIESTSMNTDSIEQGSAAATIDTDSEVKDSMTR